MIEPRPRLSTWQAVENSQVVLATHFDFSLTRWNSREPTGYAYPVRRENHGPARL